MPREIHSIKKDGKWYYRLWSTIVDAYVSGPLDYNEIAEVVFEDKLRIMKFNFDNEFPRRIKRAQDQGTSSHVNSRQRLDDWDDERED